MNILITAPSLNPKKNVNGISTVVKTIIDNNRIHTYYHYLLGSPDYKQTKIGWILQIISQLCIFPFAAKKNKVSLVHQNLPFDPKGLIREYIINVWCRTLKIPVVLHVHGGIFLMTGTKNIFYKNIAKSLFRNSHTVIVLSDLEKFAVERNFQFYEAVVLSNSIDTKIFIKEERKGVAIKPILLFLGRIHESKGIDDIYDALALLKEKAKFKFLLCGTGPLKSLYVDKFKVLLGDDFEYLGIVSGSLKTKIIQKSDVFLLPSRYGEGLPMALLETMSAGVVPVVTDDASMKYIVENNVNGIRVNKKDPEDLSEKLDLLLSTPELYDLCSNNAQKTVTDKYDISNYIIQLNRIYNLKK